MEHWALRTDETLIPNNRFWMFLRILMGIVWEEYGNGGPSLGGVKLGFLVRRYIYRCLQFRDSNGFLKPTCNWNHIVWN
jgi:hypothetical protein